LYFTTEGGNPNYWPAINYLDFHSAITGLAVTSAGILVFTRYETHIVTGTNASTFIQQPISFDQGCISHKTIAKHKNTVLFLSTDGLCSSTGSSVEVVSKHKLGKQVYAATNAIVYDEAYYCQLQDTSILVLDLRYEPSLYTLNFGTTWLTVANDLLYGQTAGGLFELFAGAPVSYTYRTGNYTEGSLSEIKTYNDIYIYATGTHSIDIFIGGVLVATRSIVGALKPINVSIPVLAQRGSSISFGLTGIGEIHEIEYKAVGRQNGR